MQLSWPQQKGRTDDALEATFANLTLMVGGQNITAYVEDDTRVECGYVEQPMLNIAEWIADNWWSLLWEPEKSEEIKGDDDFRFRHSLASAQHGFALPSLHLISAGDDIHLFAQARNAEHASVRFINRADCYTPRAEVDQSLRGFMEEVTGKLAAWGDHPVVDAWAQVSNTPNEAVEFCKLMGALGLSPYTEHRRVEAELERVSEKLSPAETLDLCLTATVDDFFRSAKVAEIIHDAMQESAPVDLSRIRDISPPGDVSGSPAWRRGRDAARKLRVEFGIDETDIDGGTKVFESLQVDWRAKTPIELNGFASPIAGALQRRDERGSVAFVHDAASSRRFAAARAAYFFWTGEPDERRLLTNAVTREQQASRAFAAELLVPQAYIRGKARRSRVSWDQVDAIAELAMVSSDVVRHQAGNSGLQLTR